MLVLNEIICQLVMSNSLHWYCHVLSGVFEFESESQKEDERVKTLTHLLMWYNALLF